MTSPVSRPAQLTSQPFAIAIAVSAAFSSPVLAQTNQGKALAPVVVTATRTPQIAKEVLSDNIIITSEEIAKSGQRSLTDLLQRQRGIEISRNGGPGTNASVFVRGANNKQTVVLVDGVRVVSTTTGEANWSAIPLSQIDRVEVVYGPLSSLYGADAVGGVIQIFTKQGEGAPAPTVSVGAGSYGTYNAETGISGSAGGFKYSLRAAHEESDGFSARKPIRISRTRPDVYNQDADGYTNDSASGRLGVELAKGHEVGFTFLHSRLDSQYDLSARFDDRLEQKVATYAAYARNQLLPYWNSHFQVSQSTDDSTNITAGGRSGIDTAQKQISWQNGFTLRNTDLLQLIVEQRKEEAQSVALLQPRTRTTDSVAAAYQLRQGAHLAALSVRNDDSSQFGSHTTGGVSYGYRVTSALRANASYATSFRAPTFNELYFPGFGVPSNKPEKGKNAEVGLHYDNGVSQYSAVYYHNRLSDMLVNADVCPITPADYPFGCAFNVNKALLKGVSLGASTKVGSFSLRTSLDFQDPKDETTNKQLIRRAKQHGTLGVDYNAGATSTGAELIFSGKRFDDVNNSTRLGGYSLLNLHASYDFARNWSLFGRWNNVLDKKYELAGGYNTAGSNVFVGVRYGIR
ncbi:MAG: vitamin transporter [Burkholderiales bacterium]